MLLWNAINKHVYSYLSHFYKSDTALMQDVELQAWAKELADPTLGGAVKGFPRHITSINELTELVSTVIMQVGPVHCAVNYLQYEYQALCSNMPFAAYADPERLAEKDRITRSDILAMLPPYGATSEQLDIMFLLSAYRYDELGEYDQSYRDLYGGSVDEIFKGNPEAISIMKRFGEELKGVERIIQARNDARKIKYNGMVPSLILNSTSI
jgi:arachidonate 15-lipoxygenase